MTNYPAAAPSLMRGPGSHTYTHPLTTSSETGQETRQSGREPLVREADKHMVLRPTTPTNLHAYVNGTAMTCFSSSKTEHLHVHGDGPQYVLASGDVALAAPQGEGRPIHSMAVQLGLRCSPHKGRMDADYFEAKQHSAGSPVSQTGDPVDH
ncbi:hypothetical protein AB0D83_37620 [Streptomyces decoyicus]|uniref:hypothetical protein n=1 Tax=Streptomyces decoyicus TaxID=249567 RepID=UPI0034110BD9